ncbi:MAG: hypothetical protein V3T05_05500 [Myxococcota bacterium]
MRRIAISLVVLAVALSCAKRHRYIESIAGIGDPCTATTDCRPPLACDPGRLVCWPGHVQALGEMCGVSDDCELALWCDKGECARAGNGQVGEICTSSGNCQQGLYCKFEGFGGTCTEAGDADIDDPCTAMGDCWGALFCDPMINQCSVTLTAPAGEECIFNLDCAPQVGIICIDGAGGKVCDGIGPDGQPVVQWEGADCPDPAADSGDFRVMFDVPEPGTTKEDFYSLPYPNDIRIESDGTVNVDGFPRPPLYAVPTDLMTRYLKAIGNEMKGFGPNQTVFLRTSHRSLFCVRNCCLQNCADAGTPLCVDQCEMPACATGCMGKGEPGLSIYAVELSDGTGITGSFGPVGYGWTASTGSTQYICGPWVAYVPASATPWIPGHTYAVFIHMRIKGAAGETMQQDSDFAAMLVTTQPGSEPLASAWTAYQPLRDWLATAPVYPNGDVDAGNDVLAAHIGGAAVFTVRDPTTTVVALGDAIEDVAAPAPAVSNVISCAGGSAPTTCADTTGMDFVEIQGDITLPNYQDGFDTGGAPFLETGGNIVVDINGVPQKQADETVTFSLTIPTGTAPGGGWPVVIYAHGTGGSFQSHITGGVAQAFATASAPAAVLGIDQVAHGDRRGGSLLSPDMLFFNFSNPHAARGNPLQMAADQLSLRRAIADISTAVVALPADGLDEAKVGFLGHSQGSIGGVLAMARSSNIKTTIFSGVGGGLIDTLMLKTKPYDLPTIIRFVLADPRINDGRINPALNMIQGYLEDVDPVNYGRHVTVDPLTFSQTKHVLHVIGVGDSYTPNGTSITLARRLAPSVSMRSFPPVAPDTEPQFAIFIDDDGSGLGSPVFGSAYLPVSNNFRGPADEEMTVVVTIHEPPADTDGHFVLFDVPKVLERTVEFFATWTADTAQAPTVVK